MSQRVTLLKQTNTMEAMTKVFQPLCDTEPGNFGGGPVGCQNITAKLRVYEKQVLQPGLNTSNYCSNIQRNVNSSVRARVKTHRRTPVSIELLKIHARAIQPCICNRQASRLQTPASLGSGARISKAQERTAIWRRTPTSSLRKSAPKSIAQECTFRLCTSTPICVHQDTRAAHPGCTRRP